MKVEHLTALGTSAMRDSADIMLKTIQHFKSLQKLPKTADIAETPFSVKITEQDGIAIFDLKKGERLVFTNVCCFSPQDSEAALLYVRSMVRGNPLLKNVVFRTPSVGQWLYTIPIDIFAATPSEMQLAGEIEFYIYYSIFLGLKKSDI